MRDACRKDFFHSLSFINHTILFRKTSASGVKEWQQCIRNLGITVNGVYVRLLSGGVVLHKDKSVKLPFVAESFSVEDVTTEYQKVYTRTINVSETKLGIRVSYATL